MVATKQFYWTVVTQKEDKQVRDLQQFKDEKVKILQSSQFWTFIEKQA